MVYVDASFRFTGCFRRFGFPLYAERGERYRFATLIHGVRCPPYAGSKKRNVTFVRLCAQEVELFGVCCVFLAIRV